LLRKFNQGEQTLGAAPGQLNNRLWVRFCRADESNTVGERQTSGTSKSKDCFSVVDSGACDSEGGGAPGITAATMSSQNLGGTVRVYDKINDTQMDAAVTRLYFFSKFLQKVEQ
jgi:hypothetical protein